MKKQILLVALLSISFRRCSLMLSTMILLSIVFLLPIQFLMAQDYPEDTGQIIDTSWFPPDTLPPECGTADFDTAYVDSLPWFGNNDYLFHFFDSVVEIYPDLDPDSIPPGKELYGLDGVETVGIRIPVQFWVYENPEIDPDLPDIHLSLQGIIDVLNYQFRANNISIRFYALCDQKLDVGIWDGALNNMSAADATALNALHQTSAALNIHIVEGIKHGYGGIFYSWMHYAIFVRRNRFDFDASIPIIDPSDLLEKFDRASTITHETGHFLHLNHTFQYENTPCFREAVTRSCFGAFCPRKADECSWPKRQYCSNRGDFLCDTPADYDPVGAYVDANCNYTGSETDWRGDTFEPDHRNIMGYGGNHFSGVCRSHFSAMQGIVMIHRALKRGTPAWISTQFCSFDVYEPDDNQFMAREIQIGISNEQTHSFHMEKSVSPVCDKDWLTFEIAGPKPSGLLEIVTNPSSTFTPDTELRLYDANLNQLAYDDDGNGNGFSKIAIGNLPVGTYFIQVNSKTSVLTAEARYRISVVECLSYDDCLSGVVNTANSPFLAAATHDLTAPCPAQTFVVTSGAVATLKAEHQIRLLPGFHAQSGSDFTAKIKQPVECADDNTQKAMPSGSNSDNSDVLSSIRNPIIQLRGFTITPKLSTGSFTLTVDEDVSSEVFVYDDKGQLIHRQVLTSSDSEIDLSGHPKGTYIVKVTTEDGREFDEKIVLQ